MNLLLHHKVRHLFLSTLFFSKLTFMSIILINASLLVTLIFLFQRQYHGQKITFMVTLETQKDRSTNETAVGPKDPGAKNVLNHKLSDLLDDFLDFPSDDHVHDEKLPQLNQSSYKTSATKTQLKSSYIIRWNGHQEQLPWFLPKGKLLPKPSGDLALFPEETKDHDDRILNQLMFIPKDYSTKDSPMKKIHFVAADNDWAIELGRKNFIDCPINRCIFVSEELANQADVIFFKDESIPYDFSRDESPKSQIWILSLLESPANFYITSHANGLINWTVSYRSDSDLSIPYSKFITIEGAQDDSTGKQRNVTIDYSLGKTKKVAWFVSNCNAWNNRLEYAKELAKHIQVDIFGGCDVDHDNDDNQTTLDCPKEDMVMCLDMVKKDYKFYLAFENSNCPDYVTEKLWVNALQHNVIPIVMGPDVSTYSRIAPPNSFIHVDDFATPQELAAQLDRIDQSNQLFNEYFKWKNDARIHEIDHKLWCRLCALIHSNSLPQKIYYQLNNWWNKKKPCIDSAWKGSKREEEEKKRPISWLRHQHQDKSNIRNQVEEIKRLLKKFLEEYGQN